MREWERGLQIYTASVYFPNQVSLENSVGAVVMFHRISGVVCYYYRSVSLYFGKGRFLTGLDLTGPEYVAISERLLWD